MDSKGVEAEAERLSPPQAETSIPESKRSSVSVDQGETGQDSEGGGRWGGNRSRNTRSR